MASIMNSLPRESSKISSISTKNFFAAIFCQCDYSSGIPGKFQGLEGYNLHLESV